jgi:hypothetical protein
MNLMMVRPGAPPSTHDLAVENVRGQAAEVARGWAKPGSPSSWALTAAVFATLADDDDLAAMAAEIPSDRLPALLFCGATCYLVAEHEPRGLIDYFPTSSAPRRMPDSAFAPALRAFCRTYRDELLEVCGRRRYQMNEVARSTQVALALGVVGAQLAASRIALIDVGTGAGLGLFPDRYCHQLPDGRRLGDLASHLVLGCAMTGPISPPVPASLPDIDQRVGIDIDPIDLTDADDRRWARACVPPQWDAVRRFDAAAPIVRAEPGTIMRSDAVEALPAVLDAVPPDLLPVVVDTYTAVFFDDRERDGLRDVLDHYGANRDLAWISLDPLVPLGTEGRYSVQGVAVPHSLVIDYRRNGVFALLGLVSYHRGRRRADLLARAHPSGTQMAWLNGA